MIYAILDIIKEQALESRYDVCSDCIKLHHQPIRPPGECLVCCRWDWYSGKGMSDHGDKVVQTPEDFPGWTDFQFSYEMPRISEKDQRIEEK